MSLGKSLVLADMLGGLGHVRARQGRIFLRDNHTYPNEGQRSLLEDLEKVGPMVNLVATKKRKGKRVSTALLKNSRRF